ncbi:MAG: hypothetical protein IPM71_03535 [Bacteroidota bacterium]|nr:MAG: hypothetical protein IPM71_03535 [Bacteroidota bacterium]
MPVNFFVTSEYPVRTNTQATLLINGEEAWAEVRTQIANAQESIHLCFWAMQNDIELTRNLATAISNPADRLSNTIYTLIRTKFRAGVKVRILLWDYPFNARQNFADTLIRLSGAVGHLEVMYQEHPDFGGSWHQKTIVIDNNVAFVCGMNAKQNDWDTNAHEAFDIRRAAFDADASARSSLARHRDPSSINPPRHDYMAKLTGDAVHDVASNFAERWNFCKTNRLNYHRHATTVTLPTLASSGTGIRSQITRTLPPYGSAVIRRTDILEVYLSAIRTAERYIYIEDQYFRSEPVAQEIARAISRNRDLIVVVVVPPDYLTTYSPGSRLEIASPSTYWTHAAFQEIRRVRPNFQFHFLQTYYTNSEGVITFLPIDLHAKLMIVDDAGYTVGSCNVNDRGFSADGEMNVSVMDASVVDIRKRIFGLHLKQACPDDIAAAFRMWEQHTQFNNLAWSRGTVPRSFIFSYNQAGPLLPVTTRTFV